MNRSTRQVLQFLVFLALAVGFTWLAFAGQDLAAIGDLLADTRWGYIGLGLLLNLVGHWARAARWQLLLEGAGAPVRTSHALVSLLNGYFVNLGVPRLGEITRCGVLNRLSGAPVLSIAGTVVAERAVDVVVLLLLTGLFFLLAGAELLGAFQSLILEPTQGALAGKSGMLIGLALIGLLGLAVLYWWAGGRKNQDGAGLVARTRQWAAQLWQGLVSALRLPRRGRFLLLTLVIWLNYFSAPMLAMLALNLQGPELLEVTFAVFLFGSMARTAPLPAGSMGAYHFVVSSVMLIWGYSESQGLGLATLNHGVQVAFHLLAGLASWVILVVIQRKRMEEASASQ